MQLIKNNENINKIINLIFCLFPVTFIIGNLAINLNVLLLILFSLFCFKKKIFINLSSFDKFFCFFFIYLFSTGILSVYYLAFTNDLKISNSTFGILFISIKTLFFFRFLLFYLIVKFLIKEKIINLNNFLLVSSIACIFVSIDIIIQFFYKKDIFGIPAIFTRKFSGPFGDELIAGGYLQRFSFFLIFFFINYSNFNKKLFLFFILFLIILIGIILSGNRMPLLIFVTGIITVIIFNNDLRKYIIIFVTFLSLFFLALSFISQPIKYNFTNFFNDSYKLIKVPFAKKIDRTQMPLYFHEFESFYDTWQLNKYFGGGVRSFRIYCPYRKNIDFDERSSCNTHPHNYYLEIFTDIGLIGFILFLIIVLRVLFEVIIVSIKKNKTNSLLMTFLILFLLEIFPLKTTGSFFSTSNSTFIFTLFAILQGLLSKKQIK